MITLEGKLEICKRLSGVDDEQARMMVLMKDWEPEGGWYNHDPDAPFLIPELPEPILLGLDHCFDEITNRFILHSALTKLVSR